MKPLPKRSQLMASISGNILEWYDFAVYGYLSAIIGALFFPAANITASLLQALSVFALGYLVRPIGGIIFGHIGDKYGRSNALRYSMYVMGISTFCLGLLPVYQQVGLLAPVLLIALRIIQGLSAGGELVGSTVYIFEIAPEKRRTFWCSLVTFSCTVGVLLGSFAVGLLHHQLTPTQIEQWGWRIPYLAGSILIVFSFITRRYLSESPEFKQTSQNVKHQKFPLLKAFKNSRKAILQVIGLNIFVSIAFYALFVWMPVYLQVFLHISASNSFAINTSVMILLVLLTPIAGYIGDILQRKYIALLSSVLIALLAYPLFQVLSNQASLLIIFVVLAIFAVFFSMIEGTTAAITAGIFPSEYRFSGIAFPYNLSMSLFGGTSPLVCTWLISRTGSSVMPALYIVFSAVIGTIAILSVMKNKQVPVSKLSKEGEITV